MSSIKRGIWEYYHGSNAAPQLSTTFVASVSIAYTIAYVLPLYLFSTTRPSPQTWRDSPAVIRGRVRIISAACLLCSFSTVFIITHDASRSRLETFHLLGWWPLGPKDIVNSLLLTMLLFIGPLFERLVVEGEWKRYITGQPLRETLDSWIGWRNFVAGPISEEVMWRSLLTSLSLLTPLTTKQTILITPLYFGVAHMHHFYETLLTNPTVPWIGALLQTLFQFTYTTLFGWYANFVFVRTGSLPAVILIHMFCNWMGLPRFWGRVEAPTPLGPPAKQEPGEKKDSAQKEPFQVKSLNILWTIAYYILLVGGALAFEHNLWPMTRSSNRLATI